MEDLAGSWKMVVMEYLSGWVMLGEKKCEDRQKPYKSFMVADSYMVMSDGPIFSFRRMTSISLILTTVGRMEL